MQDRESSEGQSKKVRHEGHNIDIQDSGGLQGVYILSVGAEEI